MPSEAVERRAANLLKNGRVELHGMARTYTVHTPKGDREVMIGEAVDGRPFVACFCEHGKERGFNQDFDNLCYHAVAVIAFDANVMERVAQKQEGRRARHRSA